MSDYSEWIDRLLIQLDRCGPQGQAASQFIIDRKVKVSVHDQPTSARWTLTGNIQLHPRYFAGPPDDPYLLSLIVHEVRHLEQGFFTALSVYGELEAWQLQFSFVKFLIGRYHLNSKANELLTGLMSIKLGWDRQMLDLARNMIKEYAGKAYRIDLLPLYPLPKEFFYFIAHKTG
jgi:hypothetical protein